MIKPLRGVNVLGKQQVLTSWQQVKPTRVPNFLLPALTWPHPDPSLRKTRLASFGFNNSVTGIITWRQPLL